MADIKGLKKLGRVWNSPQISLLRETLIITRKTNIDSADYEHRYCTKTKFSIKDFFNKCDQIRSFLFCTVDIAIQKHKTPLTWQSPLGTDIF